MGLSGRKVKQRISADPRNLAWADDAAKFGSNYLSKFGWDSSKGLGINGDGRTSHIKVAHKLDMLGIGAAQQKDPDGIAWKQNRDFENVLKRLSEANQQEVSISNGGSERDLAGETEDSGRKKRKREKQPESEDKSQKKRKKSKDTARAVANVVDHGSAHDIPKKKIIPFVPQARAHRVRCIASKAMVSQSSASMAEILGVVHDSSTSASDTPSASNTSLGTLTPTNDNTSLEKLTTSAKSVADYFKERLLEKSLKSTTSLFTPYDDGMKTSYDAPRGGIGAHRSQVTDFTSIQSHGHGIGFSRLPSASCTTSPLSNPGMDTAPLIDGEGNQVRLRKKKYKDKQMLEVDSLEQRSKRKEKRTKKRRTDVEVLGGTAAVCEL